MIVIIIIVASHTQIHAEVHNVTFTGQITVDKNTFISWSVALWFPSSRIQGQLVTVHSLAGLTSAGASSWGPSSHRRSPSLSACYTFLLWGFYCQGNGGSGGKVPPQDRPSRFRGRSVRPMRPLEDQTRSTVKAGKTSFFRGHSVMASWKDKCFWWTWTWLTNEPRGSHDFRQSRLWDSCVDRVALDWTPAGGWGPLQGRVLHTEGPTCGGRW